MHFPLGVPSLTGSKPGVGPEGNSRAHSHARKLAGFSKKKKKKICGQSIPSSSCQWGMHPSLLSEVMVSDTHIAGRRVIMQKWVYVG